MKIINPTRSILLLLLITWSVLAFANKAPTVRDLAKTFKEDSAIKITLNGRDAERKTLSYTISQQPQNGTITLKGKIATYKPNKNYFGADSFRYTANDGELTSVPATVRLIIQPVNDQPVSIPKSVSVLKDTATQITLSATDVEGDALTYVIATKPKKGQIKLIGNVLTIPQKQNLPAQTVLFSKLKIAKPRQNQPQLP